MHGSTASGEVLKPVTVYLLGDDPEAFPPPERADRSGLLAVGGDLRPERLLAGYRRGIFPWYSEGQPILWHSPDPRFVLLPERLHVSRSLAKVLRRGTYRLRARHRVRPGGRGLRPRAPPRSGRHLDHRGDAGRLPHAAPARPRPLGGGVAAASSWSEGSTAWRWVASSSGRACSPAPRCLEGRLCPRRPCALRRRVHADRLPGGDRPPGPLRCGGPARAGGSSSCSPPGSPGPPLHGAFATLAAAG